MGCVRDSTRYTTLNSIQNHRADLTMLGSLDRTEHNEGRAGGAHYQYELALEPTMAKLETRFNLSLCDLLADTEQTKRGVGGQVSE